MSETKRPVAAKEAGSSLGEGARLALGTLTVLPVRPPRRLDRRSASWAMTLAPVVGALLIVVAWALMYLLGWSPDGRPPFYYDVLERMDLVYLRPASPTVAALLVVGVLAAATRVIHLDGLADTADGLGSRKPAEAALAVMRRSDIGPFGVVSLVLALGLQVSALSSLLSIGRGPAAVALALVVSRLVLPLACSRGIPAARADGLGHAVAGTVGRGRLVLSAAVAAGALVAALAAFHGPESLFPRLAELGLLVAVVGLAAGAAFCWWCVRRLGGVTGDVLGACVEVTFTAVLVVLSLL